MGRAGGDGKRGARRGDSGRDERKCKEKDKVLKTKVRKKDTRT